MMQYKLSIQLYKNYNDENHGENWSDLNFQQHYGVRVNHVLIHDSSRIKVGRNILINRLNVLNGKIEYNWLNLSLDSFKLKCKKTFLDEDLGKFILQGLSTEF